jgi:aspartate kinase
MATGLITAKFGGSSVATAGMIQVVRDIVHAHPERRAIVVSAPGARYAGDTKVTDLLEGWAINKGAPFDGHYLDVEQRFADIYQGLGLEDFDIMLRFSQLMADTERVAGISHDRLRQFAMSRGEWLHAQLIAHMLGFEFIDAAEFVTFDTHGLYDHKGTKERALAIGLRERARSGIVVPGYYGATCDGMICTFPRDGSDISGSILAAVTGSVVYENFSDVDGFMSASPKIVTNPERIEEMTYEEAGELAFMGSPILQPHAVKYAKNADIPIHVRKTDRTLGQGTWIRPRIESRAQRPVTGISVRKGNTIISIEKDDMDERKGFLADAARVFADHDISVHNCPGSVNTLSFIVLDPNFHTIVERLTTELEKVCEADVRVTHEMSVICVVGRGMLHTRGVAAQIMSALARSSINIAMINQGSSERNIEIGVADEDADAAVRAIYRSFFT